MATNILNLANCASPDSVFNVGIPLCDLAKKKIRGVIFADQGVSFSGAEIASVAAFIAAVKTKTTAVRGSRVYPIWDILNFEDSTGDPSTGGVGNLSTATIITNDAVPVFRFGYGGSEARHKRIAAMTGASLDMFIVDEQYAVYGRDNGNNGFSGYNILQAYPYTSKFIVADSINQYSFRVTLSSITQYRDQSLYVVANSGLTAALGLMNVNLLYLSNAVNAYKFNAIVDGGTEFTALYGSTVAAMTWSAKNLQTGAAVTITSVAYDSVNKAFTVTLDSTMYTGLATGDQVQISAPAPSVLSAGGVKPFEILPIVITK